MTFLFTTQVETEVAIHVFALVRLSG